MNIKEILKKNKIFYYNYLVLFVISLIYLIFNSKEEFSLLINSNWNIYLDYFFKYYTNVGDGLFSVFVAILLFIFSNIRNGILALVSFIASGLIAQIIKNLLIMPRPKGFFTNIMIHFPEGVEIYSNFSMPSGHTATAFALFSLLSYIYHKNLALSILFFIFAVLVGFSRVYLMQHFLIDVFVGSIIGVVITCLVLLIFQNWKRFNSFTKFDNNIINILQNKNNGI